jgi:hypothetical protein
VLDGPPASSLTSNSDLVPQSDSNRHCADFKDVARKLWQRSETATTTAWDLSTVSPSDSEAMEG